MEPQAVRTRFLRELGDKLRRHAPGCCDDVDLEATSPQELRAILDKALRSKQPSRYNDRNTSQNAQWKNRMVSLLSACGLGNVAVMVDAYCDPFTDTGKPRVRVSYPRYSV